MIFLKYVKDFKWGYILTELAIVTAGILLAWQVGRWSEDAARREKEMKILGEIKTSLSRDVRILNLLLLRNDSTIMSATTIQKHILQHGQMSDSIQFHAIRSTFGIHLDFTTSVFETLKVTGVDIVSNDSIKNRIGFVYGYLYPRTTALLNNKYGNSLYTSFPLEFEYQTSISNDGKVIARRIVAPATFRDNKLLYYVSEKLENCRKVKHDLNSARDVVVNLIKLIDAETRDRG